MEQPKRSKVVIKRKTAKPVEGKMTRALGVGNPPWDKIKHLASKYPSRPPASQED